jgi:hypothetical protein
VQSTHTFYHPELLAVFSCDPVHRGFEKWYRHSDNINDPGWVRNSPLRNELVDLLNDALKAMGGWPRWNSGFPCYFQPWHHNGNVAPILVEAFNKVCKKFNYAKLFDLGLQCRAIVSRYKRMGEHGGVIFDNQLFVLVEKRSDEKLRDIGDTLESLNDLTSRQNPDIRVKSALAWSPPEDWMTRLTPPYNEATKDV